MVQERTKGLASKLKALRGLPLELKTGTEAEYKLNCDNHSHPEGATYQIPADKSYPIVIT